MESLPSHTNEKLKLVYNYAVSLVTLLERVTVIGTWLFISTAKLQLQYFLAAMHQ